MAFKTISKTIFSLALGTVSIGSLACQGQPSSSLDDGSICIGAACDGVPPIVSSNAVVNCWITPGESFDSLDCRYEPPAGYPITLAGATVSAQMAGGEEFSGDILSKQAGKVLSMAHLERSAYPLELSMDIRFDATQPSAAALQGLERVTTKVHVAAPIELSADRAAEAYIPFDLWQVNLLGRDSELSALSFGYSLNVGDDAHRVAFKTRALRFGHTQTIYLPVDSDSRTVNAKVVFEGGHAEVATISGPGSYSVRDAGVHRAAASDFPRQVEGGSALAQCWLEDAGHSYEELYCHVIAGQGIKPESTEVELVTTHGEHLRVAVGEEPIHIATVSPRAFPIHVDLVGQIEEDIVGLQSLAGRVLRTSIVMDGTELPRKASPHAITAPYSIWQVTVNNQSEGFQGALDTYILELGDGMYDRFAAYVDDAETPYVEEESITFSVATPPGVKEVNGNGFMLVGGLAQEFEFVLRPGTLLVGE